MGLKKKFKKPNQKPSTRKEIRKQSRKDKKARKHDYYTNRKKLGPVLPKPNEKVKVNNTKQIHQKVNKKEKNESVPQQNSNKIPTIEEARAKEKRVQMNLQKEMNKNRNKQLQEANLDEDREIKKLEKQLKLNKKQSKTVPKSFTEDGLDYLLEVCNPDSAALVEHEIDAGAEDFEEDLALVSGEPIKKNKKTMKLKQIDEDDEREGDFEESDEDNEEQNDSEESDDDDEEENDSEEDEHEIPNKKRKNKNTPSEKNQKRIKLDSEDKSDDEDEDTDDFNSEAVGENSDLDEFSDYEENLDKEIFGESEGESEDQGNDKIEADDEVQEDEVWEDIYGRTRTKDGSVKTSSSAYVPPALRTQSKNADDEKRTEKLNRLKRQLKGLVNRLAESNMNNVANQIDTLYMQNSRNDMNQTLTNLLTESLISNVLTPERLLVEHVVLITILHANVGSEVGAHFLQTIVQKFDEFYNHQCKLGDKRIDNTICILSQLYNFKVFDGKLMYEILEKLCEKFDEKDVECILHVLKNVGFNLRKEDPIALKNFILNVQKRAAEAEEAFKNDPRVKFMLDILLAIKNNNVSKIPNYDVSYPEHLKKLSKVLIRKGQYVSQLSISLEDLLKAEEKGKWWVVGSAWKGNEPNTNKTQDQKEASTYSEKLLQLARKQRMNTNNRRNIFCIIMSAEDYLDAFEKLVRLGLKNQQEREIIHVILHCCLQEKNYNPYYSILAQKFCEYDRKYQMIIKYSIWDKLKALKDNSSSQISNLAKLLTHLFLEKGVPFSILKIVQFSDLDKVTLRFMRQILLGILLCDDNEKCQQVFENVAKSDQLNMFKESLKLFIHHFLLSNLKSDAISEDKKELIQARAKMVERVLTKERTIIF